MNRNFNYLKPRSKLRGTVNIIIVLYLKNAENVDNIWTGNNNLSSSKLRFDK